MTLNQQLQKLIEEAPTYGVPAIIMQNGVIPIINAFAQQLNHSQYYLRQTLDDNLLLTILGSKQNPEIEKKVIYAFPTIKDAQDFPDSQIDDSNVVAQKFPVAQILFQMFTMKGVDSIIFLDRPDDYQQSKEIYCHKLQSAIKQNLSNLVNTNSPNPIA
jgi:hypothetical protein